MRKTFALISLLAAQSAFSVTSMELTGEKAESLIAALLTVGVSEKSHIEESLLEVRDLDCHSKMIRGQAKALCSLTDSMSGKDFILENEKASGLRKALITAGALTDEGGTLQVSEISCARGYHVYAREFFAVCSLDQ